MGGPKFTNQGLADPSLNPQQPVYGLLQADFVYQEDVDAGHPLNLDYFIPINCQAVKTARLSFRLRLYRTYSTFSLTTTSTDATGESGHTHSHSHNWTIDGFGYANAVTSGNADNQIGSNSAVARHIDTSLVATASSGHTHSHSHTVNVNSTLGVAEDANNNPSYTVKFDGVDHTADIIPAGPYTTDQVELDVTKFISIVVDRAWHVVSLTPSARGRIQAVMRVLYNSNLV